ncbi:MAG: xanthine dehydrogenase family protein molybdopterin-binding subunit [Candidatus Eremiobacteraeota bacterium]|nr:xanthine dehydrogenase family protein molybdopterin-binding subunit [Candidatus Eremiobacteraeota bacterium]
MIVGKSIPRKDAEDKVTGKALYIDDIKFPGELAGKVIRSPHPCARIKAIVKDPAFDWSDIVTFTAEEIPGENVFNNFNMDVPFLPRNGMVNYVGEPVMLLAAPGRSRLEEASSHLAIEYEVIDPVLTIEEGLDKKNLIYGEDNILKKYEVLKGDIQAGFAAAEKVLEGTYRTWHQEHGYIETQGIVAVPDSDRGGVTIHGSLQCPYYIRLEAQRLFTFPPEKIRVVQCTTGGAFGGKEHFPSIVAGHAALLALKAGKPVKIIYDRVEDIESTSKRHPSLVKVRTGTDRTGRLVAMDVDITFDGGAYSMATPVVLARATIGGCGAYNCPNIRIRSRAVATNKVPTSAFRGFGAPQSFYAIELHMTKVAEELGQDPYTFRKENLLKEGDYTATGQLLRYSVGLGRCMEAVKDRSGFQELYRKYRDQPAGQKKRRGIGIAAVFHGAGFTGKGEDKIKAKAGITIDPGGQVKILCSTTEMGQGMRTILPQIVAEVLQVPVASVEVERTDTDLVPDSGPTVASRTTMIIGKVLNDTAAMLIEELKASLAKEKGYDTLELDYRQGEFHHRQVSVADFFKAAAIHQKRGESLTFYRQYSHPPFIKWDEEKFQGDAYAGYGWAATVAEVEVDLETCEVEVVKIIAAHDMGRAINPRLVEGQIEGGTVQSLGYALMEEMKYREGRIQNRNLTTYIIPTSMDIPELETIIVEDEYPYGPFGAKGIGEMPHVVVAPAIASAIRQAAGVDIDEIPVTPEKLFTALYGGSVS